MTKTLSTYLRKASVLSLAFVILSLPAMSLVSPSTLPVPKSENAPVNVLSKMDVNEFIALTPKKYKELTGKKLTIPQKISLKIAQKKLKKAIRNNEKIDANIKSAAVDTSDFNIGGFVLGFLLSVVGVLIAYLIDDTTIIKWAWIGFGISLILLILFWII